MRKIYLAVFIVFMLILTSCSSEENKDAVKDDYVTSILYSNLMDDESKEEVKESLIAGGLDKENVDLFLKEVDYYNKTVGDVGMVENGFKISKSYTPEYDFAKIVENWEKSNSSSEETTDNRNNCRMTTFLLANNLIDIEGEYVKDNEMLFMDNEIIQYSNNGFFDEDNINRFNTFFGDVNTDLVKDIDTHLKKMKDYWSEKKVSFKNSGVSVITVWFHSELDNNLFVGHAGILTTSKKDGKLLFIEKTNFEEPYQVLKFNNRTELNDYLMGKYDISYGQPTARPFIMENDELLKGYRPNPKNNLD